MSDNSLFKSFYFLEDWREAVYESKGSVVWEEGILKIVDDSNAHIVWEVLTPQPIVKGKLQISAYCDKPVPFFAFSKDKETWNYVYWTKQRKKNFSIIEADLNSVAGGKTLYLKFFQPSSAHTYLKYFYVLTQFPSKPVEIDKNTLENLRSLGYIE